MDGFVGSDEVSYRATSDWPQLRQTSLELEPVAFESRDSLCNEANMVQTLLKLRASSGTRQ